MLKNDGAIRVHGIRLQPGHYSSLLLLEKQKEAYRINLELERKLRSRLKFRLEIVVTKAEG